MPKQAGEPADSADGYGFYYLDSTSKATLKPSPVSLKMQHNVCLERNKDTTKNHKRSQCNIWNKWSTWPVKVYHIFRDKEREFAKGLWHIETFQEHEFGEYE